MHQHEDNGIEDDVSVDKICAQCRAVEEPVVEGDAPGRMGEKNVAPDGAGVVRAARKGGDGFGSADPEIVEDVINADEKRDRSGRAVDSDSAR
jgi:hypothetical protein